MKNNVLKKINMKLGSVVKFKYGNSVVKGTITTKKDNTYVVDVDTINDIKQEYKTVITVNTATVLDYLFHNANH